MGAVNVGEEDYSQLYEELPGDLIQDILAWLPIEYLYRFTTVCKQWNALFSSTSFLRKQWAEAPPNKNAWLVLGAVENNRDCWTYSCFTRSWRNSRLSLDFLEGEVHGPIRYVGSGAGLFLINATFSDSIYVCDPLTAKCFVLPRGIAGTGLFWVGEIGIVEEGEDGYKVLVLRYSNLHQQNIVEIYDSSDKAWTMAGLLPRHLNTYEAMDAISLGTAFSGGYFYCLMVAHRLTEGIICFNMVEGTSIFEPLPHFDLHRGDFIYFNQLLHCGSRILFVQGMENQAREEEEVLIIWEFNKDAATKWKEIARKPPTVPRIFTNFGRRELQFSRVRRRETPLVCAAIGDCLYFKMYIEVLLVVYNLTQNSWTFLRTCPRPTSLLARPLIAFKPRPYMKLE